MKTKEALYNYCLRLADSNMIHGQRLAEWCSRGPFLEEDIALSNMALDMIGQAEMIYEYASSSVDDYTADDLAFKRSEREYYNCLLVEQQNGDFAQTMMKVFLYSAFTKQLYESLLNSNDETLSGFAAKAIKEVKYHLRHSSEWLIRFGNGTDESKKRVQQAVTNLWRFTQDMFVMNDTDTALVDNGISFTTDTLLAKWQLNVNEIFAAANINTPESNNTITGGYNGIHTEHLGIMLCEMQFLQRAYPDAKW
ncbi:MAG TPA: phenylacetate-CoA oxygenase subunit PaaC [Bacteroidia bacterium]|jgi:ring-1,2-phenylacetyl-CoA epoxidase subunit PaaC|nr:phenylacetate-CoA oxygenase subunit PaaC [Bacteroidia bacterium]HMU20074.1 phenylacetate-CoA oxygenase subunit PaaC [Bacteroidia bacterium]